MSCLPLLSFSPSIPSVFRPYNPSPVLGPGQKEPLTPISTPELCEDLESPYDKLSQVSVSHRRVDSFEWVMTQSAPNTPPTSGESSCELFSPVPARLIRSAPLPVPNESWSRISKPGEAREKRGYFDWWTSPSLGNDKGYTKISEDEGLGEHDLLAFTSTRQNMSAGSARAPKAQIHESAASHTHAGRCFPSTENHQVRPSQELNALGIVFPYTPPPSPPVPTVAKSPPPIYSPNPSLSQSTPPLPKRVSFSPVIDEVIFETSSDSKSLVQQPLSWGSYLPSSFLVARPPLPRTTSSPVSRKKTAIRPILRRSTSLNHAVYNDLRSSREDKKSTEMIRLPPLQQGDERTTCETSISSSMPTQRLSSGAMYTSDSRAETDRAFAMLLQTTKKPARRRCDSMVSIKSSDGACSRSNLIQ
ncbi:hypothetical protein EKO04_003979 [Ascochyta lentis]|uniref:Uncharacterized protein n=1 Tax=Ascochyta lentis TaxID=205686 RepID=A0A8H7J5I6_9PLEO|nr:hypothetical protein EKO04_003979 [Ascochyta lentis]